MVSSSVYVLLRLAGWSYIPDLATRQLLQFVHRFMSSPPSIRTSAFARHYRIAFVTVVLGFLSYNLIEALRAMPPNFYQILSVYPHAGEEELKQAFKLFARRYHPDRGGSQESFIQGRLALQTLKDPVTRFAYDRFGPDIVTWSQCTTIRDYLRHGLLQASGYHVVTGFSLLIWSSIQSSSVVFWRYLLFLTILVSELSLILDYPSTMWRFLFPQLVPYQHILFLHQLFVFFSVALSKVAPVIFPTPLEENWDSSQFRPMLEMVHNLSQIANREVFGMLQTGLQSIHPSTVSTTDMAGTKMVNQSSEQVMDLLTTEMENMMIESRLKREDDPLRSAWEAAITKGRVREQWKLRKSRGSLFPISPEQQESRLPSPRRSPPPAGSSPLNGPKLSWLSGSYVRARSLSC